MTSLKAGLVLLGCTAVVAQELRPTFDVASVKPAVPVPEGVPFQPGSRIVCPLTGCGGPGTGSPGRIMFTHASIRDLIQVAYDVRPYQIEGPGWLNSVRFDIVATLPPDTTRDEANLMLQHLLAERFQLTLHRSSTEAPVYGLVVTENGPKVTPAVDDPTARPGGQRGRGTIFNGLQKRFEFDGQTMARFAQSLESEVDRPVIDMTGLDGRYDIRLDFTAVRVPRFMLPAAAGATAGGVQESPSASELFTALTEQLGLKLESRRAPVPLLVVDSVSRQPTAD